MKQLRILIALLLVPYCSFAWNGIGHSTGGAIAYYYLKNHGKTATIARVIAILEHHPWYTAQWKEKMTGLTGEQKNIAVFMLASTYPDDARQLGEGGAKSQWHYIDYPFVPAGQHVQPQQPKTPNAEVKTAELIAAIAKETDQKQQAIDLCWIFHLIEDVHQPLHSSSLFDNDHPDGDVGGNKTFIIFPGSSSGVALHSYWDGLIKGTFATIPANAQNLLKKPAYQEGKLTELTKHTSVHDWIFTESFSLAKEYAYKNGTVNGTKEKPTAADNGYSAAANTVGEKRIVLAGIRLGQQLSNLFH
ncbi:MAG: hypothetical protein JWQ38_1624 [Flavipsychrobacter sp.]|nr:hypothetical protein [Flavipsychrobacter sp.]